MRSFKLLLVSAIIVGIDQLTKTLVRYKLNAFSVIKVLPVWNFILVYNKGAAFSFLASYDTFNHLVLTIVAALVSCAIIIYLIRHKYSIFAGIGLSFILGGAVGNLIDRIRLGFVTDFIDWHYGIHHFATFNVADSFVSVGVVMLILANLCNI